MLDFTNAGILREVYREPLRCAQSDSKRSESAQNDMAEGFFSKLLGRHAAPSLPRSARAERSGQALKGVLHPAKLLRTRLSLIEQCLSFALELGRCL